MNINHDDSKNWQAFCGPGCLWRPWFSASFTWQVWDSVYCWWLLRGKYGIIIPYDFIIYSFSHTYAPSVTHSHSLSLTHTHSLTLTLTHTRSHSLTHTDSLTLTDKLPLTPDIHIVNTLLKWHAVSCTYIGTYKPTHNHPSITLILPLPLLLFCTQSKSGEVINMWNYPALHLYLHW